MDFLSILNDFDRSLNFTDSCVPRSKTGLHGPGGLLTNSPLVFARLVRRQDLKSQDGFSMDFIDFLGF